MCGQIKWLQLCNTVKKSLFYTLLIICAENVSHKYDAFNKKALKDQYWQVLA
jgi:hypothetical protein